MPRFSQAGISKDIEDRTHEHDNERDIERDSRKSPPSPTVAHARRMARNEGDLQTKRNLDRIDKGKRYGNNKRKKKGRSGGRS